MSGNAFSLEKRWRAGAERYEAARCAAIRQYMSGSYHNRPRRLTLAETMGWPS